MITQINFDSEITIPSFTTEQTRKRLTRQNNEIKARRLLSEKRAEQGQQWDFTVKVVETLCSNDKLIAKYTDKFSLIV